MSRLVVWGAVLVAAAVLAFWLQGTIQDACIVPAVKLLRMGGLLLRSVPQSVFWSLLVAGVGLIALGSLTRAGRLPQWRRAKKEQAAVAGPIRKLAHHLHNTRRGPYFKWLVAHRLGELAQAVPVQRGTSKAMGPRGMGAEGNEGQRAVGIQAYMEASLDRPPMGHPRRRFLSRRPPTPLDLDP
jgi:hypothetical protein